MFHPPYSKLQRGPQRSFFGKTRLYSPLRVYTPIFLAYSRFQGGFLPSLPVPAAVQRLFFLFYSRFGGGFSLPLGFGGRVERDFFSCLFGGDFSIAVAAYTPPAV